MSTVLERVPSGSRVAVIRLRSLGDCVLTTPALALLKAYRPDLRIGVVVEERFGAVFEGLAEVDCILAPKASALFSWRPRLTLNLHGGTRSMVLTAASRAPLRAGFAHHRYSLIYTHRIPRAQAILGEERAVHTAEHIASAMFWLGVPATPIPRAILRATKPAAGPAPAIARGGYAVLHPFASEPAKTWPADGFLAVASHLKDVCGLEPVFLAGPRDDLRPFARFRVWNNTPLSDVKSLMAGAQLFVGNDSGPAHIAAAFGIPVVVLFGSSDRVTWGPWRTEARVLASRQGIDSLQASQVIEAVHSLKVNV